MRSVADPRSIITPYAFNIAPKLLNRPLASPWRRGLALAIDLLMVAILAELPVDMLLAIVLAVAWVRFRGYRIKAKLQTGVFIGFGLWLLFAMIHATIDGWPDDERPRPVAGTEQSVVVDGVCEQGDTGCVLRVIGDVAAKVIGEELTSEAELSAYLVERYGLSESQAREVAAELMSDGAKAPPAAADNQGEPREPTPQELREPVDTPEPEAVQQERSEPAGGEGGRFSIIQVVKGTIQDLGLGLGWASVYFTVFTAWFHGQTLGKKLLAIRVIQLDNTPLSLWDAFGRYGGYGAGLATGLTGFLQIFWDPNRQGIHDKIASTVVVDLRAKARKRARAMRRQITTIDMKEPNG